MLPSVFSVITVFSMIIKQVTNPLLVTGKPLTGFVRLRRNPKWSSLFWSVDTLDNTDGTSRWFLGAKIAALKDVKETWFSDSILAIINEKPRARYSSYGFGDRWGSVTAIDHESATALSNFIIRTWNEVIEARNRAHPTI